MVIARNLIELLLFVGDLTNAPVSIPISTAQIPSIPTVMHATL